MQNLVGLSFTFLLAFGATKSFPSDEVINSFPKDDLEDAEGPFPSSVFVPYGIVVYPNEEEFDNARNLKDYAETLTDEGGVGDESNLNYYEEVLTRNKRQAADLAAGLALSHQDRNGNDRPVGKPFGRVDLSAVGNDGRNYHAHAGVGVGSVVWRSKNNRHSVGLGAYADRGRGRFQGFRYRTRPNAGAGIGYRFRF